MHLKSLAVLLLCVVGVFGGTNNGPAVTTSEPTTNFCEAAAGKMMKLLKKCPKITHMPDTQKGLDQGCSVVNCMFTAMQGPLNHCQHIQTEDPTDIIEQLRTNATEAGLAFTADCEHTFALVTSTVGNFKEAFGSFEAPPTGPASLPPTTAAPEPETTPVEVTTKTAATVAPTVIAFAVLGRMI